MHIALQMYFEATENTWGLTYAIWKVLMPRNRDAMLKILKKSLIGTKLPQSSLFYIFQNLVFVITPSFFIQNSSCLERKYIFNIYRDSAEEKKFKIKKMRRRRPICQIAHFKSLATLILVLIQKMLKLLYNLYQK